MNIHELLLGELKKRYWIVLAFMVLFSVALCMEKMFFTEVTYRPTSSYVQKVVSMSYKSQPAGGDVINYQNVLGSNLVYHKFLTDTKDKYDYSKIVKGWQDLPLDKKVIWWQKHMTVASVSNNLCTYGFYLPAEEIVDVEYMRENADRFMMDFVGYSQQKLQTYLGTDGYRIEDSTEILSEQKVISTPKRIVKYIAIGMILGALVGTLVVFGNALRKRKNV